MITSIGSLLFIFSINLSMVLDANGGLPNKPSYNITPTDHKSACNVNNLVSGIKEEKNEQIKFHRDYCDNKKKKSAMRT